ncbi:MAG TPA: dual specificity protein phosphatase family protein [Terriglobales bacterium]|nr:dual specificity protein phosphatase family protein [Terriglobales bacterium]
MSTKLYWTEGPWRGRLAIAARPRGGDWLDDEMSAWRREGIDTVLSLLTRQEEQELDLKQESSEAKHKGMKFLSLPVADREVPRTESDVRAAVEKLDEDLSSGKNVVIHCRQGIGRSGLVGACLLIGRGMSPGAAVDALSASRGLPVPETAEQRHWIDQYASNFAGAK